MYATDPIGTQLGGYKKTPVNAYEAIDTPTAVRCKLVKNISANIIFIPTKTITEWNSFATNAPLNIAGTSIVDCAALTYTPPAGWDAG